MQISKNLIIIPPHPPGPSVTCFSKASWSGFADNISLMKAGSSSFLAAAGLLPPPPPPVHIYLLMEAILFIYHWSPSCLSIIGHHLVYLSIIGSYLVYLSSAPILFIYLSLLDSLFINISLVTIWLIYLSYVTILSIYLSLADNFLSI